MSRFAIRCHRYLRPLCQQTSALHEFHLHDHELSVPTDNIFIKKKFAPLVTAYNFKHISDSILALELGPEEFINCKIFLNAEIKQTGKYDQVPHFQGLVDLAVPVGETKILVVAEPQYHREALEAGAHSVITADDIKDIGVKYKISDYDQVICTEGCLKGLQPMGKLLQTKMPHKRKGTVTNFISKAVSKILKTVTWESVQCPNHYFTYIVDVNFARVGNSQDDIAQSLDSLVKAVKKYAPANGLGGPFIRRVEIHANDSTQYLDHTASIVQKVQKEKIVVEKKEGEVEKKEGEEKKKVKGSPPFRPNLKDRDVLKKHREASQVWAEEVLQVELDQLARDLQHRWSTVQGKEDEG